MKNEEIKLCENCCEKCKSCKCKCTCNSKCKCQHEMNYLRTQLRNTKAELSFEKEKNRRMNWIFGLVGGNAFIEEDKDK